MCALDRHRRWLVVALLVILVLPLLAATTMAAGPVIPDTQPAALHVGGHCDTGGQDTDGPRPHRATCGLLLPCDHGACASAIVPSVAAADPDHRALPASAPTRESMDRPDLPDTPPPRPRS